MKIATPVESWADRALSNSLRAVDSDGVGWLFDDRSLLSASALAIALALDEDGLAVMRQAIEGGAGQEAVGEDPRPSCRATAGHDQGPALVALLDDLVEVL